MGGRTCPQCGSPVSAASPSESGCFPFCSPRCQMVDLGKWFNEDSRASRPAMDEDELLD